MSALGPEAKALLEGVRDDLDPTAEDRDRVARALASRLGIAAGTLVGATTTSAAGAVGAAGAGAGTASAGSVGLALVGSKWLAATLVVAAVGVGGGAAYRAARAPSRLDNPPRTSVAVTPIPRTARADDRAGLSVAPETAVRETATPETTAPALARPPSELLRAGPPATPKPATAHDRAAASVAAETRLLLRADEELRSGSAAHALDLLDEHARAFPHGALEEERSAERVRALCALGRADEARAEVNRFLAHAPDSPLAVDIRRSCGGAQDP